MTVTKIVSRTIETQQFLHPGCSDPEAYRCRRCGNTAETDLHVFNECPETKLAQIRRHDFCVNVLEHYLKLAGWQVEKEKVHNLDLQRLKPDLVARKDSLIKIIDVAIAYELRTDTLAQREESKQVKYAGLARSWQQSAPNHDISSVGIAIGSLGTVTAATFAKLKSMGLDARPLSKALSIAALRGTAKTWRVFRNTSRAGGINLG